MSSPRPAKRQSTKNHKWIPYGKMVLKIKFDIFMTLEFCYLNNAQHLSEGGINQYKKYLMGKFAIFLIMFMEKRE